MAREAAAALCARSMASLFLPRAAAGAAGVAGASSGALAYAAAAAAATSSAPATGAGAAREMSAASAAAAPASGLVSLPPLPYDYSALEPVISAEIMHLHHSKHHQAYVTNFNKSVEALEAAKEKADAEAIAALTKALKFNGGGHVNHSIFWKNLAPVQEGGGAPPTGALAEQIERQWGSLDSFIGKFSAAAVGVEGSGWAWLGLHPDTKVLNIVTTQNQDPCITTGHIPLLGIDVWEHAYYLQYKNVRPDYLKNVWKVVNWKDVGERFDKVA